MKTHPKALSFSFFFFWAPQSSVKKINDCIRIIKLSNIYVQLTSDPFLDMSKVNQILSKKLDNLINLK